MPWAEKLKYQPRLPRAVLLVLLVIVPAIMLLSEVVSTTERTSNILFKLVAPFRHGALWQITTIVRNAPFFQTLLVLRRSSDLFLDTRIRVSKKCQRFAFFFDSIEIYN